MPYKQLIGNPDCLWNQMSSLAQRAAFSRTAMITTKFVLIINPAMHKMEPSRNCDKCL